MRMTRVGRGVAAAVAAVALGGCSGSVSVGRTLDTAKLEGKIRDELAKTVTGTIDVTCPRGVKIKEGDTFECTVKADDGSTGQVKVTQKDDKGNVNFESV